MCSHILKIEGGREGGREGDNLRSEGIWDPFHVDSLQHARPAVPLVRERRREGGREGVEAREGG